MYPESFLSNFRGSLHQSRVFFVPRAGVEPARIAPLVFETSASTDSAIWARLKKKRGISYLAERGGFEPPVRLPVRQFSKLLVSATHPSLRSAEMLPLRSAERAKRMQRYDNSSIYPKIPHSTGNIYPQKTAICILDMQFSPISVSSGSMNLRQLDW